MRISDIKTINDVLVHNERIVATLFGLRSRNAQGGIASANHGFEIDGTRFDGYCYRSDAVRHAKAEVARRIEAGQTLGRPIAKDNVGRRTLVAIRSRTLPGVVVAETLNAVKIRTETSENWFSKITHKRRGGGLYTASFSYV